MPSFLTLCPFCQRQEELDESVRSVYVCPDCGGISLVEAGTGEVELRKPDPETIDSLRAMGTWDDYVDESNRVRGHVTP